MKRVLFIFISLMICVCGYSQKHMKFQGIEIDGTKKAFVDQLIKKGYKYVGPADNNIELLSGTFTGRKATIGVLPSSDGIVTSVSVLLPEYTEWRTLLNLYKYYKDIYTQKYGKPVYAKEKDKTYNDDNYLKMEYLVDGRNEWECGFETVEGEIILTIRGVENDLGDNAGVIFILYSDKANLKKRQNKDIDDI